MGVGLGDTFLQPNGNSSLVFFSTNPDVTALSVWVGRCVGPHPYSFWGTKRSSGEAEFGPVQETLLC